MYCDPLELELEPKSTFKIRCDRATFIRLRSSFGREQAATFQTEIRLYGGHDTKLPLRPYPSTTGFGGTLSSLTYTESS